MNILVTGGAGFIGSHLADELLKEHRVTVIDNLSNSSLDNIKHNLNKENFEFIQLDILNKDELEKVFSKKSFDSVFHLAANSDIRKGREDTTRDLDYTFLTTFNVLNCMVKNNVKEIVFSSTSAIYGETTEEIGETTACKPISFYGAAKLASEAYIYSFAHNFGLNALTIRFPNVVGERATHGVIFDFIKKLRENNKKLIILGDGKQEKPYMYVKDLVRGILLCWKKYGKPVDFFNLAPKDSISVDKITGILCQEMNLKPEIVYTGGDRGWKGDVPCFKYSTEKAEKIGFYPEFNSKQAVRTAVKNLLKEIKN